MSCDVALIPVDEADTDEEPKKDWANSGHDSSLRGRCRCRMSSIDLPESVYDVLLSQYRIPVLT